MHYIHAVGATPPQSSKTSSFGGSWRNPAGLRFFCLIRVSGNPNSFMLPRNNMAMIVTNIHDSNTYSA